MDGKGKKTFRKLGRETGPVRSSAPLILSGMHSPSGRSKWLQMRMGDRFQFGRSVILPATSQAKSQLMSGLGGCH